MKWLRPLCALLAVAGFSIHAGCATLAVEAGPKSFASPEAAAEGLVNALKANDRQAALDILGHAASEWISSGDAVADKALIARFVDAYEQKHELEKAGDARMILLTGDDDYPFPFPIVKANDAWQFDLEQGREEILNRRIGRNELFTIQTLLAIVDAQYDYVSVDRDGNGLLEYARKFISSPGTHDGLYWPAKAGEPESPLGPLIGQATKEGYGKQVAGEPSPYHGYHYRMLTGQGKDAQGGAYDYLVHKDRMIGGFAVVAYPAKYGASGVKSFLVNHRGVVYEKDLGPDTGKVVEQITAFDPNTSWQKN